MIRALLACALLSGCADVRPVMQRQSVDVTVVEIKGLPNLGRSARVGDKCFIALREYPTCLAHEMRHCLEGSWHGNAANDKDCY